MNNESNGDVVMTDIANATYPPIRVELILEDIGKKERRMDYLYARNRQIADDLKENPEGDLRDYLESELSDNENELDFLSDKVQYLNSLIDNPEMAYDIED